MRSESPGYNVKLNEALKRVREEDELAAWWERKKLLDAGAHCAGAVDPILALFYAPLRRA